MTLAALANAIGWTILHSLWEGAAIAVALSAVLGVVRPSRLRYAAACGSMLAMLAGFVLTAALEMPDRRQSASAIAEVPKAPDGRGPIAPLAAHFRAADLLPYLAAVWMCGVLILHLRSVASWLAARRLRARGVCIAPEFWQGRMVQLRARLQMTVPVALLESCFTAIPVVAGYLRPVILVPIGMLASMPACQIEAILLHELAHVRRRDYLVNLLQIFVENLLFYHPAVWWISGVVRSERENCCDDLVVAMSGDAREYASALAALETNRWTTNEAVLAANGGNLMKRITRILYPLETPRAAVAPVLLAGLLTIAAAVGLHAWQGQPVQVQSKTDAYQKWVTEDVVYIIHPQELAAFANLTTDAEREKFIEQFWERRDPTPNTVENEFKEEHYQRIAKANARYSLPDGLPGWKTDRGRVLIVYGPPDELESHPNGGSLGAPYEEWLYHELKGVGKRDKTGRGDFEMTPR
jgi:GWxTD domain-containing protein